MLQKLRPKLTFANVMVVVLAFIVLGGGAYAATSLPRNSVGTKQLKRGAVTKAKIKKSTLRELKGRPAARRRHHGGGEASPPAGPFPPGATLRGAGVAFVSNPTLPGEVLTANGISFGGFQTAGQPGRPHRSRRRRLHGRVPRLGRATGGRVGTSLLLRRFRLPGQSLDRGQRCRSVLTRIGSRSTTSRPKKTTGDRRRHRRQIRLRAERLRIRIRPCPRVRHLGRDRLARRRPTLGGSDG